MAGCCNGGAQQNINIYMKLLQTQIYIQTLTQLWIAAALDVTVAFPGCPVDFDTDPGDVGDEVAARDRALCMIVQSYVDEMFNTGMSWIEDSAIGITAIGVGALAVPIIPIWVIGAGFSAVALALSSLYGELQRSDYREYMACAMYDALKGVSTNNRGAFADAWDNLPARPPPSETPSEDIARDAIEAWARAQLSLEGNYVAFVSQLAAAMEIAGELTDADCGCLAEWTHIFDFTASDGGWVGDAEDCAVDWDAHYTPGVGWESTGLTPEVSLMIRLPMVANGTFTKVSNLQSGSTLGPLSRATETPGCVIQFQSDVVPPTGGFVDFIGSMFTGDRLTHLVPATIPNRPQVLSQLSYRGVGINPFL